MTGATYTGTLVGSDGSKLIVRDAELVPTGTPTPTPTPGPAPVPGDANTVRVGGATYPLAAINPTRGPGRDYPGGRGTDQLVAYQQPALFTETNQYGTEVTVLGGRVISVIDRLATGQTAGVIVPASGYVLSGHGRARDWLNRWAVKGATVQIEHVDVPEPAPGPAPGGSGSVPPAGGGRTIAVYLMDGRGTVADVPPEVNQIRVAFLRDGGLVEWGGDSPAKTASDLRAWKAAGPGRQILVSIGGAGGSVNLGQVEANVRRVEQSIPLDGIDFDIEGGALDVAAAVRVARGLASGRESLWVTSFVPPGGPPVARYLDAARQCKAAGLMIQYSQQTYDTRIAQSDIIRVVGDASAALGEENVLIGCMVGNDPSRYSTVDQWETYTRAALAKWPNLGGAFLWEAARPGTSEWARRMAAVLA